MSIYRMLIFLVFIHFCLCKILASPVVPKDAGERGKIRILQESVHNVQFPQLLILARWIRETA
ncbi:hypothetical protein IJ00_25565 [Calothrix sp. 336/3]|nr:hypothetical protein IJ00_25565 [Calothrix sp. 336/3]